MPGQVCLCNGVAVTQSSGGNQVLQLSSYYRGLYRDAETFALGSLFTQHIRVGGRLFLALSTHVI